MEEILSHNVYGKIILGFIGALIFYLFLKFIGLANKKLKIFWVFYKSGNEAMVKDMLLNQFEYQKVKFLFWCASFLNLLMTIIILDGEPFDKDIYDKISDLTCIVFLFMLLLIQYHLGHNILKFYDGKTKKKK